MQLSAKQWADAFMSSDVDQLTALVVEAGGEPDWREVFLAWLDTCHTPDGDVYFAMLLAAKMGLLPVISSQGSGGSQ